MSQFDQTNATHLIDVLRKGVDSTRDTEIANQFVQKANAVRISVIRRAPIAGVSPLAQSSKNKNTTEQDASRSGYVQSLDEPGCERAYSVASIDSDNDADFDAQSYRDDSSRASSTDSSPSGSLSEDEIVKVEEADEYVNVKVEEADEDVNVKVEAGDEHVNVKVEAGDEDVNVKGEAGDEDVNVKGEAGDEDVNVKGEAGDEDVNVKGEAGDEDVNVKGEAGDEDVNMKVEAGGEDVNVKVEAGGADVNVEVEAGREHVKVAVDHAAYAAGNPTSSLNPASAVIHANEPAQLDAREAHHVQAYLIALAGGMVDIPDLGLDEETMLMFIRGRDLGRLIIASVVSRAELGRRLLALGLLDEAEAKAIRAFVMSPFASWFL